MTQKLLEVKNEFDLIHIICVWLLEKRIETVGNREDLEYDGILKYNFDDFENIEVLNASLEGQLMPRCWAQGKVECIISKPNDNILIGLFYHKTGGPVIDAYNRNKEIDRAIKELFK